MGTALPLRRRTTDRGTVVDIKCRVFLRTTQRVPLTKLEISMSCLQAPYPFVYWQSTHRPSLPLVPERTRVRNQGSDIYDEYPCVGIFPCPQGTECYVNVRLFGRNSSFIQFLCKSWGYLVVFQFFNTQFGSNQPLVDIS